MTVVYLDRVVLLNLAVDYLLLLATARLAGLPLRRGRLALAAALGALYAAAVFLPGCRMLAHPACRLAAGVAVCRLAWRRERRPWRLTALFFLLSGALAGLLLAAGLAAGSPGAILSRVYYADISWPVLLGSAIGFGLLLHLVFRQGARHEGGELMGCDRFPTGPAAAAAGPARHREYPPGPRQRPAGAGAGAGGPGGAVAAPGGRDHRHGPAAGGKDGQAPPVGWRLPVESAALLRRGHGGRAAAGCPQRLCKGRRHYISPGAAGPDPGPRQRRRGLSGPVGRKKGAASWNCCGGFCGG